jgi:hypothetical protein
MQCSGKGRRDVQGVIPFSSYLLKLFHLIFGTTATKTTVILGEFRRNNKHTSGRNRDTIEIVVMESGVRKSFVIDTVRSYNKVATSESSATGTARFCDNAIPSGQLFLNVADDDWGTSDVDFFFNSYLVAFFFFISIKQKFYLCRLCGKGQVNLSQLGMLYPH